MVLSDNGMESYVFPVADLNGAAKPEQSKTVNITANGMQTVTPDSGKVLSSVFINTNVPAPAVQTQEKSVTITQNGDSEVTPDAGKYLSKVNISVNVQASSGNKLPQVVDGTVTTITAEDLAGATTIRDSFFQNLQNLISVQIPNSVTVIGESAFSGCPSLESVTIAGSVESFGDSAFYNCDSLTILTLSEGIGSIGYRTFDSCGNLINVTIPASVASIDSFAFQCGSAENKCTITMLSSTPPSIQSNSFVATYLNQIIVPAGCGDAYKAATNWANFADYIVEATE